MNRAIDNISGRITEPYILTEENAWTKSAILSTSQQENALAGSTMISWHKTLRAEAGWYSCCCKQVPSN